MGEVYRARDTRLDRHVAVKVLPESVAGDPDRRARFEREAKAIAALSHPNILAIYDFGEHDGVFYAATELLEGATLRDQLAAGPLPPRKVIDLGVQIARGLAAAHDRGIVHRDLKPENLFLVSDGQIKILDFGLARQLSPAAGSGAAETMQATDPGKVMGTVGYMAPEQVRGLPVDARADLFSLGAVLYEMATGRRAFDRPTAADTISAILREDPPEASGAVASVSPALDRILRHCLEKDPTERFQTARDVAFALSSLTGSAASTSGVTAIVPSASRRRWWLLPAAIAVIAAIGGLLAGRALAPRAVRLEFTAMTRSPQAIFSARFMPDGRSLVFSSAPAGTDPSLFELRDGGTLPRPFGPPKTHLLAVSRSGELAVLTDTAYLAHRLMLGTLSRMRIDGAPRAIAERIRDADWLPDGETLAVIRDVDGQDQLEFPMGRVVYRTAGYVSDPRVSPDGTRLAFMDHPAKFDNRGWVKVVDRDGRVTTVSPEFRGEEGVAWSGDGQTVLFGGAAADEYHVYAAPADGSAPAEIRIAAPGNLFIHDSAPDGRLAVTREDIRYGVVARGAGQEVERDLTPLDQAWIPSLSADGTFAVFTDGRGGHDYAVTLRGVDGSPPVRLGDGNAWDLSPDGRWVTASIPSTRRCVVYPTGAGATVPIEMGALEACQAAFWFPDGKRLVIGGNEPGKPLRAYRVSFPGGTPEPFLPEGLQPRQVSDDGRSVLVVDPAGGWSRIDGDGAPVPVPALTRSDIVLDWSADTSTVVAAAAGIPAQVFRVHLSTGARVRLGELTPADRAGLLDLYPADWRDDGRQYAYGYVRRVSALYTVK
jgi:Tol biopolymer transport system component